MAMVTTVQNLLMVHVGPVHPEEVKTQSMSSLWRTGSFFMDEGFMQGIICNESTVFQAIK